MVQTLSNDQQRTLDAVFQHPVSNNLERREVRSMLEALGEVTDEHNGNLKVDRNGHTLVLHPAHANHPAGVDEVMQIRHFIEASDLPATPPTTAPLHLLVVIEHRQALIFASEMVGSIPQKIAPHVSKRYPEHVHDVQEHGGRQSRPVGPSFYNAIAESIEGASEILMFGTGEGGRKALDTLIEEIQSNHTELFPKIVGSFVVGGKHMSEELLLEKAREFYQTRHSLDHREPSVTAAKS